MEDQGGEERLADIRCRFGDRVAVIVRSCSDSETSSRVEKDPWPVRKTRYLDHLRIAPDEAALVVSVADKLHNARAILADYRALGEQLWPRFNAERDDLLWYYRSLADIFQMRLVPLAEELGRVVAELHRLAGSANGGGIPWRRHDEAGGVLIHDGEVLLRRTGTGHFISPKGHIETNETLEQAERVPDDNDWRCILEWLGEAIEFLAEPDATATRNEVGRLVFYPDADPRSANWLRIAGACRRAGYQLPMWAAMWLWRLGHDRKPQFWRKIGSVAKTLGFPKQRKPPGTTGT